MVPVLLTVLAWLPALAGLGALLRHEGDPGLRPAVAGLVGIGVLGAASTVANFFVPISGFVATAFWATGVVLFVLRRRWLLEEVSLLDLAATAAVAVLAARLAWPREWMNYDTGLYHLQVVRWMREHPVPLGLALLHDRLGFNSLFHAAAVGMELLPAAGKSIWFANLLPTVLAASAGFTGLRRVVSGDLSFANLLLAAALVPATASLAEYPGLGNDRAAALLAFVAFALWARALEAREWPGPEAEPATALALVALAVKISTGVLLAGSLVLLAWRWRKVRRPSPGLAVLGLAIALPWLVRNVALSGCLVFPASATCLFERPWGVGSAGAENLTAWITSWARKPFLPPEQVLRDWSWLRGWPELYDTDEHRLLVVLLAAGLLLWLGALRRASRPFLALLAIAVAGAGYWFLAAPAPRFGLSYLYPLALMPLAFALSRLEAVGGVAWRAAVAAVILLACSAALRSNCGGLAKSACTAFEQGTEGSRYRRWMPALEWPRGDFPVATERRPMRSGQAAYVASPDDRCWDTPLPCTPWLNPDLVWIEDRFEVRP